MQFVDEATVTVKAGDGGRGCVSFRREKYVPMGGPDGGNGGHGGSVLLRVSPHLSTLLDFRYRKLFRAERGVHGMGKNMHGRCGEDLFVDVPPGTLVHDDATGELLADLVAPGETFTAAAGGRGGRGNASYVSSVNQAPERAQPGLPGEERVLRLELKLLAEVGLVGLPNAGKSTLLSRISHARPKVADYPFTTLAPVLGVVSHRDEEFVVADLPGLIEGAHQGAGLGHRFLRHAERTRALVHVLDGAREPGEIAEAYRVVRREMEEFSPDLAARPTLVAFNKTDVTGAREAAAEARALLGIAEGDAFLLSAATGEGIPALLDGLLALRRRQPYES